MSVKPMETVGKPIETGGSRWKRIKTCGKPIKT